MPITVTTPKLTPRQLRLRRPESTHYRVSFGSVFFPPSSSSQEKQSSIFLPEGEREKTYLDALNSALNIIREDKFESLPSHKHRTKFQESVNGNVAETCETVPETRRIICVSVSGFVTFTRVSVAAHTAEPDPFLFMFPSCFSLRKQMFPQS